MGAAELVDSRRLTGPNLLGSFAGAVMDVRLRGDDSDAWREAWEEAVREILHAVGWRDAPLHQRVFRGGASVAFEAPLDALYAATEVNEWALEAANARLAGDTAPDVGAAASRLRALIAEESNPGLQHLRAAAEERGVAFLADDDHVSVGLGRGSRTFGVGELPDPAELDWTAIHDVPLVLVTGTNGKTTTVRLVAAMARAAGRVAGMSTTDWIRVGDELVDAGDWSGPGGARAVLRDRRVEVAILETARGGMLRRGLGVARADAACVLNVAEDHMGEWGVDVLDDLVRAKLVVLRAVAHGGRAVLGADDPGVAARGGDVPAGEHVWFGLDPAAAPMARQLASGGRAFVLDSGQLVRRVGVRCDELVAVAEVPCTLGGAARYNVANALAACALGESLGFDDAALVAGLRNFGARGSGAEENPGRGNVFELGGLRVLVDFAHNPHGMGALAELACELPGERRALLLGQAGDRDDDSIRGLVAQGLRLRPDRVFLKAMPEHGRGRDPGEVVGVLAAELRARGVPAADVETCGDELAGVRAALAWGRPGDLLVLTIHARRDEVLELLRGLRESGWAPGSALPG